MPDVFLFLVAAMMLTLAPGPDNIYVLTRGVAQGKKAGFVAALGFSSGLFFHTLLAVLGFAAIIKAYPAAYHALQYAGAAYLVYLGIRTLRSAASMSLDATMTPVSLSRIFWQSVIANILNPKVTLFFIAFLPQFVNVQAGHVAWQMLLLAVVFILQALAIFSAIAFFSGIVGAYFKRQARAALYLNRLAGCAFVGLGIRIALPE
ncbi:MULTISPECIES: LysE family translocator [unclassified Herbaspirillum]|jgi:threonine/homoserine/homoserine lactone efflux protein|uniref:LysE family translocator n=1 Tax=unclassified Herbaspirillum TaxID=2624150 RepID=UPI000E2FB32A|nr:MULTISPECIES: LysE family translocator [unclassified Herbaspirillum]RFB73767.1 LysE family translocator [Herbaspirillum sp. 3R-3a1]TFI10423.1 LysE family translocator [Herbaspirillum sp. 3R11]TFI16328.1 LysE family translocator [Herbaspirillum sp. 3R-11]TFI25711.1 LysE family translocator [Herbaspirillum sp. 3C11]